jgi:hypothetical protein
MVLAALVSTCVLGFESVIKFIAWTLNYRPVFPKNKLLYRGKIYTHKTHVHDLLISSLGVGNLIKCGMLNRNDTKLNTHVKQYEIYILTRKIK